ncbi:MAG: RNA polymerase sigma factor region1.1 domain-containing protein, partial [Siculibacillus sp.]
MATKAGEQEETEAQAPETQDGPLLDLSDAAVKRMIKTAKKRGFVTYDELNDVLPSEQVASEQIEDILAMLNEMGINVVETEEAESEEEGAAKEEDEPESTDLVESQSSVPARTTTAREPADRTDDPVRMYLREMGSV